MKRIQHAIMLCMIVGLGWPCMENSSQALEQERDVYGSKLLETALAPGTVKAEDAADNTMSYEAASLTSEEPRPWTEPGNTSAAILAGGWYLDADCGYYVSDGGVWRHCNDTHQLITASDARNLNLFDDCLYYTTPSNTVQKVSAYGGEEETVFTFSDIAQLYVMGLELRFLSNGMLYSYDMEYETVAQLDTPPNAAGFIPTPYGNLFLSGSISSLTVLAEQNPVLTNITRVWRDGAWLVWIENGETRQAWLRDVFTGGFNADAYGLHDELLPAQTGTEEQQLDQEAAYYKSAEYAELTEAVLLGLDGYSVKPEPVAYTAQSLGMSSDQQNMLKRIQAMLDVEWTPVYDLMAYGADDDAYMLEISSWASPIIAADGTVSNGVFTAGKTYHGIPYSQPVLNNGYVCWAVTMEAFMQESADPDSMLYHDYANWKYAGPYYGNDCTAFASFCWGSEQRRNLASLIADDAVYIGKDLYQLQIGDVLEDPEAHVTIVTDIGYNAEGEIVSVEITEQTMFKPRRICFGSPIIEDAADTYYAPLSFFVEHYFGGNYAIYRRCIPTPVPRLIPVGTALSASDLSVTDVVRMLTGYQHEEFRPDLNVYRDDLDGDGRITNMDAVIGMRMVVS